MATDEAMPAEPVYLLDKAQPATLRQCAQALLDSVKDVPDERCPPYILQLRNECRTPPPRPLLTVAWDVIGVVQRWKPGRWRELGHTTLAALLEELERAQQLAEQERARQEASP